MKQKCPQNLLRPFLTGLQSGMQLVTCTSDLWIVTCKIDLAVLSCCTGWPSRFAGKISQVFQWCTCMSSWVTKFCSLPFKAKGLTGLSNGSKLCCFLLSCNLFFIWMASHICCLFCVYNSPRMTGFDCLKPTTLLFQWEINIQNDCKHCVNEREVLGIRLKLTSQKLLK